MCLSLMVATLLGLPLGEDAVGVGEDAAAADPGQGMRISSPLRKGGTAGQVWGRLVATLKELSLCPQTGWGTGVSQMYTGTLRRSHRTAQGWGSTWAAASTGTSWRGETWRAALGSGVKHSRVSRPDEHCTGPVQGGCGAGWSGAADGRDLGIRRCGVNVVHLRFDGALL